MADHPAADTEAPNLKHIGSAAPHFDWIFIGDKDGAKDLGLLREHNIKYILNCTPPKTSGGVSNFHEKSGISYCRLAMNDNATESLSSWWDQAWEFLELVRVREDGCVLVHCNMGVSRSTSMVISYLMKYFSKTYDDAMDIIRPNRPQSNPNDNFIQQLKQLYEKLKEENGFIETSERNLKREREREAAFTKRQRVRGPLGPSRGPSGPPRGPCAPTSGPAAPIGPAGPALAAGPSLGPSLPSIAPAGPELPRSLGPALGPSLGPSLPPPSPLGPSLPPSGLVLDETDDPLAKKTALVPPGPALVQ